MAATRDTETVDVKRKPARKTATTKGKTPPKTAAVPKAGAGTRRKASTKASSTTPSKSKGTVPPVAPVTPRSIRLGDALKIERRYVVDGILTCITDEGRFHGVQQIGSAEHLILDDPKQGVRMIPLPSISEILLVAGAAGEGAKGHDVDPSIA